MKLIQWHDGTYGVIKGLFMKHAVGGDGHWWFAKEYWPKYCKFSTAELALKAANKIKYKVIKHV